MAGIVLLTPALFMSQVFWGPQVSLPLISKLGLRGGSLVVAVLILFEALVAALPFGILFGCLQSHSSLWGSALIALIPAALIFTFTVWAGNFADSLWWTDIANVFLFVLLLPFFSLVGSAIRRAVPAMHYAYPVVAFVVLALFYTIGPHLYLRYVYGNPV